MIKKLYVEKFSRSEYNNHLTNCKGTLIPLQDGFKVQFNRIHKAGCSELTPNL